MLEERDFFQRFFVISLRFDLEVKVHMGQVKGHMGQGQIRVPNKGRWAHDNVKLLHFIRHGRKTLIFLLKKGINPMKFVLDKKN